MLNNDLYVSTPTRSIILIKNRRQIVYTLSDNSLLVDGNPRLHIFKASQIFKIKADYLVVTSGGYTSGHIHLIDISKELPVKLLDWQISPYTQNEITEFYIRKNKFNVVVYSRISTIDGTSEEDLCEQITNIYMTDGLDGKRDINEYYEKYYPNEASATCAEDMIKDITLWKLVPISFNSFDLNILKKNADSIL